VSRATEVCSSEFDCVFLNPSPRIRKLIDAKIRDGICPRTATRNPNRLLTSFGSTESRPTKRLLWDDSIQIGLVLW